MRLQPPTTTVTEAGAVLVAPGQARQRSWGKTLIRGLISVALILWLLSQVHLHEVLQSLHRVRPLFLGFGLCLQFVGSFLTTRRWQGLLHAQGIGLPMRYLYGSWMVGCFFKQFLPATIGSDAIRVYDTWRRGVSRSVALATIMVDRLVGTLALMSFAVGMLAFASRVSSRIPGLSLWIAGIVAILVGSIWFVFVSPTLLQSPGQWLLGWLPGRVRRLLERLTDALAVYRGQYRALLQALGWSFLLQMNVILFYFVVARALDLPVPFQDFLLIVPIASVILMLPVSINGIGLREGVFVFLLAPFGVGVPDAIAYAWTAFGLFLCYGLLGGLVYAIRK